MGQRDDVADFNPLCLLLTDKNPNTRRSAVEALSRIGGTRIIDPLSQALKDGNSNVRSAALARIIHEPTADWL